ncbi:MAG: transcription antitermination factor NusB [Bacteroidota bacterium]
MLSRRNIRVKVMQCLYAISRDNVLKSDVRLSTTVYRESINQSYELYLFNLLQIREITKYSLKDEAHRKKKHLPSDFDKNFSAKLYKNPLIQSLVGDEQFELILRKSKVDKFLSEDNTRLLYIEFAKTPEYKSYLNNSNTTNRDHLNILLFLFKYSIGGETYNDLMDDYFSNWWDDKSLVVGAMKKTLKALPLESDYIEGLRPGFDTVTEFGEALLQDVFLKDVQLLEIIEPTLKNWDAERVAIIDMILLKMALSELLNFPTIPTKVTLNEFVEIAKLYSTDKSKDFINGILDRLLKKLNKEGAIVKEGRGLV